MVDLLYKYKNGDFIVKIYSDGTKIRMWDGKKLSFEAERPESIDLKVTNYCNYNCKFCHEGSSINGEHARFSAFKFLETMLPGTEVAIGGGKVTSYPFLLKLLNRIKKLNLIANMTVKDSEFIENYEMLEKLSKDKLIYGLGVSYGEYNHDSDFWDKFNSFPNAVLHVISGVISPERLKDLYSRNIKILILGYKEFRRGIEFGKSDTVRQNIAFLQSELYDIIKNGYFRTISFDNLALKQLDAINVLGEKDFSKLYMGDDGEFTMFIDAVERKFCKSSTTPIENRYELKDDIGKMFKIIKEERKNV